MVPLLQTDWFVVVRFIARLLTKNAGKNYRFSLCAKSIHKLTVCATKNQPHSMNRVLWEISNYRKSLIRIYNIIIYLKIKCVSI